MTQVKQNLKGYKNIHQLRFCSSWVILDDEPFDFREEGLEPHVVRTNWRVGLTDEDIQKALEILMAELPDIAPKSAPAEMSAAQNSKDSQPDKSQGTAPQPEALSEDAEAREAAAQKAAEEGHHGRKL